ncbi:hypothetical protein [Pseudalkalibacillus salsuginis]|uniref:hypothetical protein n=1 Tax=Pseudalkalibacillus salsuginis TaxID=2910972 RepID=UPI001F2BCCFD|nr:hypothetical protein [Pseudalkalibacillus salsuginis]MCF6409754.1 hypothetical protein [Pseudalkalibacillus salsuginis]
MGFTVFFFIAYLVSSLFIIMEKKLSIVHSTFIYLLMSIITINVSWIVTEELKLIEVTDETMNYLAFIINRTIITPMILVMQLHLIYKYKSTATTFLITLCSLGTLLIVRGLAIYFNIHTYKNWNIGFDLVFFLVLHLIAFYTYRLLRNRSYREVNES